MQQIQKQTTTEPFRFAVVETNDEQVTIEVSPEDYESELASGVSDDETLKPGQYKLRRRTKFPSKEAAHPSNIKVELTLKLDLDVLNYFTEQAGETDAAIQILINQELRAAMERDQKARDEQEIGARLLQDKTFISALAQELKKVA